MDYAKLTTGTKVFYTGDMANVSAFGTIVAVHTGDKWYPVVYDIELEDGRACRSIMPSNFAGEKRCGERFWVRDEYEAFRRAGIVRMAKEAAARGSEQAAQWLLDNAAEVQS